MSGGRMQFRAHGRDIYADLTCECPNPSFVGTNIDHLMKHRVLLRGYADDNFFDRVNAEPSEQQCRCGRRYRVQWFRDGVEAEWLEPYSPAKEAEATP